MIVVTPADPPTPTERLTEQVSTRLTADDKEWLVAECARKGMSQSAYLRRLVLIQRSL